MIDEASCPYFSTGKIILCLLKSLYIIFIRKYEFFLSSFNLWIFQIRISSGKIWESPLFFVVNSF